MILYICCLSSDFNSAKQYLKLEVNENGKTIRLANKPESSIQELQFLRQLVLPVNPITNQEGFEEYFEVLVETIEHKLLGFVFCKRGVYLSRRIDKRNKGDEVSLQLLSLPRDNKKRLTGFFPSMIPILANESQSFAQRFQNFIENEIKQAESGGVDLLLNCTLKDIRFKYKHWLSQGPQKSIDLLGEGKN